MKFFIMAGGLGRRAEPLSRYRPKPAFPLDGVPLISRLLAQFVRHGLRRGYVNLHHLPEAIRRAVAQVPEAEVRFFTETRLSGNLVLRRVRPACRQNLLVVNGDTWLDLPVAGMEAGLRRSGADLLLLVRPHPGGDYRGVRVEQTRFAGRDRPGGGGQWMFAGAFLIRPRALDRLDQESLFDCLEAGSLRASVLEYDGPWLDFGSPRAYLQANFDFRAEGAGPATNRLSPGAALEPGAEASGCVVWDGARIGAGARLRDCIVTDRTVVGPGEYAGSILAPDGIFPLE